MYHRQRVESEAYSRNKPAKAGNLRADPKECSPEDQQKRAEKRANAHIHSKLNLHKGTLYGHQTPIGAAI